MSKRIDVKKILGTIIIIAAVCILLHEFVFSKFFANDSETSEFPIDVELIKEVEPEDSATPKGPACCPR